MDSHYAKNEQRLASPEASQPSLPAVSEECALTLPAGSLPTSAAYSLAVSRTS